MPSFTDEIPVAQDRSTVWAYVKDVDNWAHLFPGYQRHLLVEPDHYFWQVRGDAGVWSRLVEFDVHVTKWSDPEDVVFEVKAKSEPVEATGRFYTLAAEGSSGSTMGFELESHATGTAAPMINALLKRFLADQSASFLASLGTAIGEASPVARAKDHPTALVPAGPGAVLVDYRAPRTAAFETWWKDDWQRRLHDTGLVKGHRRYEVPSSGPIAEYREIVDVSDVRSVLGSLDSFDHEAPGIELLRPPYLARQIGLAPQSLLRRLLATLRRTPAG